MIIPTNDTRKPGSLTTSRLFLSDGRESDRVCSNRRIPRIFEALTRFYSPTITRQMVAHEKGSETEN